MTVTLKTLQVPDSKRKNLRDVIYAYTLYSRGLNFLQNFHYYEIVMKKVLHGLYGEQSLLEQLLRAVFVSPKKMGILFLTFD
jgi:hypothetical protein